MEALEVGGTFGYTGKFECTSTSRM